MKDLLIFLHSFLFTSELIFGTEVVIGSPEQKVGKLMVDSSMNRSTNFPSYSTNSTSCGSFQSCMWSQDSLCSPGNIALVQSIFNFEDLWVFWVFLTPGGISKNNSEP